MIAGGGQISAEQAAFLEQRNVCTLHHGRTGAKTLKRPRVGQGGGQTASSHYLLHSLDHRLQPVGVDLAVAVQEGEDGGRGRVGSTHTRSDQT